MGSLTGRLGACLAAAAIMTMGLAAAGCSSAGTALSAPVCRGPVASFAATAPATAASATTGPPVDLMRPAMGFNPFNSFGTTFGQSLIVAIVQAMARNGMRAAGYRYVILDDGWQGPRTAAGQITADPSQFPCGIKRLADFVHQEGFDLGLYTTPGSSSCAGHTGSAGHISADARTFASWGVDYVKLDWCNSDYAPAAAAAIARQWRAALDATHRRIILSINAGGSPTVASWAHTVANSWRVGGDICGSWYNQSRPASPTARNCYHDPRYHMGIVDYLTSAVLRNAERYVGPGHYLDPDMLEVGTLGKAASGTNLTTDALSPSEARTNFSMWAMWSAPLIAGNDPRTMNRSDLTSRILLNREIIAIDQDPLGLPATLIQSPGGWQVWRKALVGGRLAVAIVNLSDRPTSAAFAWAQLGVTGTPGRVRDVWAHRNLPVTAGVQVDLPAHATAVYLITA